MPTQKIQILILAVAVAVVALSFWLTTGFERMAAQAQSDFSRLSPERQGSATSFAYQPVLTDTVNALSDVELLAGRSEDIEDLQSAIAKIERGAAELGAQSINAGYDYIPASAFRHDGISPASEYRFFPTGGFIRSDSASLMCLAAPVYVPNGATFTGLLTFFIDDSASEELTVVLRRFKHSPTPGSTAETVVGIVFPGVDDSILKVGFLDPFQTQPGTETVSNEYGYSITFCFEPNTGLEQLVYGFIVTYS